MKKIVSFTLIATMIISTLTVVGAKTTKSQVFSSSCTYVLKTQKIKTKSQEVGTNKTYTTTRDIVQFNIKGIKKEGNFKKSYIEFFYSLKKDVAKKQSSDWIYEKIRSVYEHEHFYFYKNKKAKRAYITNKKLLNKMNSYSKFKKTYLRKHKNAKNITIKKAYKNYLIKLLSKFKPVMDVAGMRNKYTGFHPTALSFIKIQNVKAHVFIKDGKKYKEFTKTIKKQ